VTTTRTRLFDSSRGFQLYYHRDGCNRPLGSKHIYIIFDNISHSFLPSQILRPSGQLRSLTHLAVIDGFESNPANFRGLRIGIDASIWFFHAAHGRDGENPELRTLFFRCARLMSAPFLPLFIFDGPKRPKIKRGKRISGEKHWLVDSMKGIIEAFGFEWRMVRLDLVVLGSSYRLSYLYRPLERRKQSLPT